MMTKVTDKLARNLLSLRRARGLSQGQLEALSGVKRSTISTIENSTANPNLNSVVQLAYALGVSFDELLSVPQSQETQHYSSSELGRQVLSDGTAFKVDLLPKPIPGLQFESLTLRPYGGHPGVPHLKGTWEYFTCTKGEVKVVVEGEEHRVKQGEVLSFPGDQKHSYRNPLDSTSSGISIVVLESRGKVIER